MLVAAPRSPATTLLVAVLLARGWGIALSLTAYRAF
jgi:hypothetical protein